ncbi:MAG: GNAT family N-acetyltransferase [Pseudomonadota bacterium]
MSAADGAPPSDAWMVRDALDEDHATLVEMMRDLQAYELRFEPNRAPPTRMAAPHLDALARWAARNDGGVLVATPSRQGGGGNGAERIEGFLAFAIEEEFGCFVARENQRFGVISDLFVREPARGRGVGHALLDEARARLTAHGIRRLEVTALWGNTAARAAYEAMGFAPSHLTYAETLPRR